MLTSTESFVLLFNNFVLTEVMSRPDNILPGGSKQPSREKIGTRSIVTDEW